MKKILSWLLNVLPFKKNIFLLLRIFPVPQSIYQHLYFKGAFSVRAATGRFKMQHYGYELENEMFWKGLNGWEKTTFQVWSLLSQKAKCIIDVGANTGVFSLLSKTVNEGAAVFAFEPVTRVARRLLSNIELNGFEIRVVEKGLSNFEGKATIYDIPAEHVYSVTVNKNLNLPDQPVIPTEIYVTTLAAYARANNLPKVDLVKIDVETHEPEVLEGMLDMLRTDRPALIIEILNEEVANRVNGLLGGMDYLFYVLDDSTGPRLMKSVALSEYKNILACSAGDSAYLKDHIATL